MLNITRKFLPLAVVLGLSTAAHAQVTRVANAASMVSSVPLAPGSIIAIFGSHLATGIAVTDNPTAPPTQLGGTSVTIGGVAAALFFVSPRQINAVMGATTPQGAEPLVVSSPAGTFSATVTVSQNAPPGIFSLFGSGTDDGAVLNAVNFVLGPFSVMTDKGSTFLAIFMTGLNLSVTPVVTVGGVPVTVQFFGPAPCCEGMEQVNVMLSPSLQGAGRVEIVVESGGETSNTVEEVLLPNKGESEFPADQENQPRSRELAGIAYIPGTSLVLVSDENDDVVRVIDVSQQRVMQVIALPSGSGPVATAVNSSGTLAVVAERRAGMVAIINLTTFTVAAQVPVGFGPLSLAISGATAVVANENAASVSFVNIGTATAIGTPLTVGNGPRGVAVDPVAMKAYVTNEDSGSVSVIDLTSFTVSKTITLGANTRPASIQLIPGSSLAVIAVPSSSDAGEALVLNLSNGTFSTINVNPARSGGSSDIAINGTTAYFADQTGATVSYLPISIATGQASSSPLTIPVDLGPRALAIDTKDNLLLVSCEGSGTLVLVDLASNQVISRIKAVRSQMSGDDGDDHSDHQSAATAPSVLSVEPASVSANSTFTLTVTGANLTGATAGVIINPAQVHGQGNGESAMSGRDKAFSVSNLQVNSAGTQLTATVMVNNAAPGPRLVAVLTPGGISSLVATAANTITVGR